MLFSHKTESISNSFKIVFNLISFSVIKPIKSFSYTHKILNFIFSIKY